MHFVGRDHEAGVTAFERKFGDDIRHLGAREIAAIYILGLMGPAPAAAVEQSEIGRAYINRERLVELMGPWSSGERALANLALNLLDGSQFPVDNIAGDLELLSNYWAEPVMAALWYAAKYTWPEWWQQRAAD